MTPWSPRQAASLVPAAGVVTRIARLLPAIALVAAGLGPAAAQTPPQQPFPRIEAGAHIGAVPRLAVAPSGRLMVSASYDKTIRVWSLPDGRQRTVLRPPIGPAQEGELYAVAISPDGRRVFAAGATGGLWDGTFCIYLFDVANAVLVGRLPGLPSPVNDLAVSPDGTRLAAGLAHGGVREWDARSGKPLFQDTAIGAPVRRVAFDSQGRLFATAADGKVRAYDRDGKKAEAEPGPGLRPWGLAVSPGGSLIAVAYDGLDRQGRLRVDVLSANTLAPVFAPDVSGLTGEGLLAIAWVADTAGGVQLLAGGYARGAHGYVIRRWDDFGLGPPTDLPVSHDTVLDIRPVPGGGAVYATEDPGWGRLAPDGTVALRPAAPMADLRPARAGGLTVSASGSAAEFATSAGLMHFDVVADTLSTVAAADPAFAATKPPAGLTDWQDTAVPRLHGVALPLDRTEFSRSAVAMPGGGVLLGTDTHLRLYAGNGRAVASEPVPAAVSAVTVTPDGRTAVAALLDGTVRWYGVASSAIESRGALFTHADGMRWVLFTPDGLFDHAGRGGDDLVGIQMNRGQDQQPEWTSFSQAYRALYAPAAVRAALAGNSGPANARLKDIGDLRARLGQLPQIEIAGACAATPSGCQPVDPHFAGTIPLPAGATDLRLTLRLTDHGLGIGGIDAFINARNAGRTQAPAETGAVASASVDLSLDPGDNRIQLRVYDKSGDVFAETAPLELSGEIPGESGGRLFVLAIGIDHFAAPSLTLNEGVADATTFAGLMKQAGSKIFQSVDITLLTDAQATKAGILAAFDRLAGAVRPSDTFLFYAATHGAVLQDDGRFLLVPQDVADVTSWTAIARQSIGESALIGALSRIRARDALLFLDTCHSGVVTADAMANVGHETGRYLLAASSSVQEAMDSYDGHNGVFVYALREAFDGRVPHGPDGAIGALALGEYLSERVGVLARRKGHEQDAVFKSAQSELRSFPVGTIVAAGQ